MFLQGSHRLKDSIAILAHRWSLYSSTLFKVSLQWTWRSIRYNRRTYFPFLGNIFFEYLLFIFKSLGNLGSDGHKVSECWNINTPSCLTEPLLHAWRYGRGLEMSEHSSSSAGVIRYGLHRNRSSCLQHHAFKLRKRWVEMTLNLQPFLLSLFFSSVTVFASSWNGLATSLFTASDSCRTFCAHALFFCECIHCSVVEPVFHPALSSLQPASL